MTPEQREAFVARPLPAIIATVDAHGRAHAVPVIYLYENGEFMVITERNSPKVRNAARTGRATLCIDDRAAFRYVTVEGPVRVVDPVTYETRLRLHTHYRGREAALKATADGAHDRMVALIITPERWY
jgi:PPOX class probable F420-dependent enzyme